LQKCTKTALASVISLILGQSKQRFASTFWDTMCWKDHISCRPGTSAEVYNTQNINLDRIVTSSKLQFQLVNLTVADLTLRRPLLPYRYSYKASCAGLG